MKRFLWAQNKLLRGSGEGACLEMTHQTGLEVRMPLTQTLSARPILLLHGSFSSGGRKEYVYLPRQKGPNTHIDGVISRPQPKHLCLELPKLQVATNSSVINHPYLFNTLYVPGKTQKTWNMILYPRLGEASRTPSSVTSP